MPSIKIRDEGGGDVASRKQILYQQLHNLGLQPQQINEAYASFYVITDEINIARMETEEIKVKLSESKFIVTESPQLKALKTVIVRNLDKQVESLQKNDLANAIEDQNEWAKVEYVVKIPNNPKMIKVRFENTAMAQRANLHGLVILNQSITQYSIEPETFISVEHCKNCFSYEHRYTNCNKDSLTLCSQCGEDNHRKPQCKNKTRKCLNCGGAHATLQFKCPVRKKASKDKEIQMRKRTRSVSRSRGQSYATTASINIPQQPIAPQPAGFTPSIPAAAQEGLFTKIFSAIAFAYMQEFARPGTFHRAVDTMYEINNIPKVKFPEKIEISNPFADLKDLCSNQPTTNPEEESIGLDIDNCMDLEEDLRKRRREDQSDMEKDTSPNAHQQVKKPKEDS